MFSVLQVTLILRPECQTMKHSYSTFFIVIHLRFEETGFRSDRRAFSDMRNSSVNSNGGRCSNHYYQRDINSLPLSALPASFVLSTSLYTVTSTGRLFNFIGTVPVLPAGMESLSSDSEFDSGLDFASLLERALRSND
ncbi:hypothetical protein J6590_001501 [Homalodisca vitripennis]|nr:hypothetical protein J6590_001501 [Homalodisca vitripennis]